MQRQNGPRLRVIAAGLSDPGRVRERNEDTIGLCESADERHSAQFGWLYLLADGVGGHAGGGVASHLAAETISAAYYAALAPAQHTAESTFQPGGKVSHLDGKAAALEEPIRHLQQAFLATHTRIREVARLQKEYADMRTTCLAAVVKGNHLLIVHVGHSRAYLLRPSSTPEPSITCLTQDHSLARVLVGSGLISPEELHNSPARHKLLRVLGGEQPEKACPDLATCLVQPGDRLLLCCDGLWSELPEHEMAMVVSNKIPSEACAELIRLANEAGGKDNLSTVVLSFL
jgi:PPM family protein phosphatase